MSERDTMRNITIDKFLADEDIQVLPETEQNIMPRMEEYNTGDILLFSDRTFFPSRMIEYFSESKYSHAAIILRDPTYIDPKLTGLYIMESTGLTDIPDVEDKKLVTGVQIRPLYDVYKEYDGAIYWRKLNEVRDENFNNIMLNVYTCAHNKPYDINPKDWIEALFDIKLGDEQLTSRFFCSAFVAYVYTNLGFISNKTQWTIIRPKDLGTENVSDNRITLSCNIDNEFVIKKYDSYCHYFYSTY